MPLPSRGHFSQVTGISRKGIIPLVECCQNLIELNVGWIDLTESALDEICSSLAPSLKKLNISGHRTSLADRHILELVERCPELVELDISDWSVLS